MTAGLYTTASARLQSELKKLSRLQWLYLYDHISTSLAVLLET